MIDKNNNKKLYVLHGDIEELDYIVAGVFDSLDRAQSARVRLNKEYSEIADEISENYGDWDGWLIVPVSLNVENTEKGFEMLLQS